MYPVAETRTLELLKMNGPMTKKELAARIPAALGPVHIAVSKLLKKGTIHIGEYLRNPQGRPTLRLRFGAGEDAPKPAAKTSTERVRDWRDSMTAEERDFWRAKMRATRRKPKRDKLTSALYGSPSRSIAECAAYANQESDE